MTLRARLTVTISAIVVVVTIVVGIAVVSEVRSGLIDQVDAQLRDVAVRPPVPGGAGSQPDPGPPANDEGTVFRTFASVLFAADGTRVWAIPAGYADDPDPLPDLAGRSPGELIGSPATVAAIDGSLDYRLIGVPGPDGGTLLLGRSIAPELETVDHVELILLLAGAVLIGLVAAGSWSAIRRGLRPVDRMIDAAGAIAAGDLSVRLDHPADDDSELGRLARALDEMVVRIEEAFDERTQAEERVRRFAADASHELRTPIAAVHGYAELYQQGGIPAGEGLDRAMDRIASESGRMGHLVEDLLLLAKLDQQQPLVLIEVDLTRLVVDAVADLRAVEPDRPVRLDAPAPVRVSGDEARLRQVTGNLLTNARVHTEPGTPIHVSVGVDGDEAVLIVADEGPGIDPELAARIFERFFRADKSRRIGQQGSGLGLSIVAGVAAAHGGRVEVGPRGGGAVFTVRLPLG